MTDEEREALEADLRFYLEHYRELKSRFSELDHEIEELLREIEKDD